MSIDQTERRTAFVLAGLGGLASVYLVWYAIARGGTTQILTANPVKGVCPTDYHLVHKICEQAAIIDAGAVWLQCAIVAITSIALALFAWRRKRVGVIFVGLFEGLATSSFGLPFLVFGLWVLWRAWRLQRYGVATFSGASAAARAEALARKEGRPSPIKPAVAEATVIDPERPRPAAEPSKRYTPKKTPKRR